MNPAEPRAAPRAPSLRVERQLLRQGWPYVVCLDEVGRGALAGPVCVGVVVIEHSTGTGPRGVADSKLLDPARREALAPRIRRWAQQWAVGCSSAEEIDTIGLTAALRRAAIRALETLQLPIGYALLDGSHNWLDRGSAGPVGTGPVVTRVKADRYCTGVAAASILAKVHRDAEMARLMAAEGDPYGWAVNKGYATPEHRARLSDLGPSAWHRLTWGSLREIEVDLRDGGRGPADPQAAAGQVVPS